MKELFMLIMTFVQLILMIPMALLSLSSLPCGVFYGYVLLGLSAPYYLLIVNCLMKKTRRRRRL